MHIGIDTSQAHQHVVSRYPMWVNVSRTCELACKTRIRVSWMKHCYLSLSFPPPPPPPPPSPPPPLSLFRSHHRFRDKASGDFCEIFIARAWTRGLDLRNGSRAEVQAFFFFFSKMLTEILTIFRRRQDEIDFARRILFKRFDERILPMNHVTCIISLLSLELTKNCHFVSGKLVY
jgi:hypothetical protein